MNRVTDFAERLFVLLLAGGFLVSFFAAFGLHPQMLLLAVSEMLSVAFIILRKSGRVRLSPYAIAIALGGTAAPLLVRPVGAPVVPAIVPELLMASGVLIAIWAKVSLNRSFGVIAANRGVKTGGPYRFVRHPMYLGYIVTQLGFLLLCFSAWNLLLYLAAWGFQFLRVREEESVLLADEGYARYAAGVRWRIIPAVI